MGSEALPSSLLRLENNEDPASTSLRAAENHTSMYTAVPRQSPGPSRGGQPRTLDENHASAHIQPREQVLDLGSLEMQNGPGSSFS